MGNETEKRKEFSDETVEKAWKRSGGKCEKCGKKLKWENRGRDNDDCWEAHHKDGDAKNNKPENCQILCWSCHEETFGDDSDSIDEMLKEIFK